MNKKFKRQINRAKNAGLSNIDIYRMKESSMKIAKQYERQAAEKAFLYMLAIPLNILVTDYWSKTAKRRAPEFIDKVLSLFDSVDKGIVTSEDLADLLKDVAGIDFETDWIKKRLEKEDDANEQDNSN